MPLTHYFARLFRAVFSLPDVTEGAPATLVPRSAQRLTTRTTDAIPARIAVAAYRGAGLAPAAGLPVRFSIVRGEALFVNGGDHVVAETNIEGISTADVRLNKIGAAIVTAAFDDGRLPGTTFRVQTQQTTYALE